MDFRGLGLEDVRFLDIVSRDESIGPLGASCIFRCCGAPSGWLRVGALSSLELQGRFDSTRTSPYEYLSPSIAL